MCVTLPALAVMVQAFGVSIACVSAATIIHDKMLHRIMRAPMTFFDTTPVGRILNRFSQDMNVLDSNIRMTIIAFLSGVSGLVTTIIVICYTTPIFIAFVIPLGLLYYFVQVITK